MVSLDRSGLLGTEGGESSSTLTEPLLGGLLNGDTFSDRFVFTISGGPSAILESPGLVSGLSDRCTGEGVSVSRWRRSSADRRGGGGEGGLKAVTLGELRGSRPGERVRLGILNCFAATAGEADGLTISSEFKKLGWSFTATFRDLPFGGECGGSTVKAGAGTGRGASGGGGKALRAGECGIPFSFGRWGAIPGLFLGIGGGSFVVAIGSRGISSFGPGEAVRLEG